MMRIGRRHRGIVAAIGILTLTLLAFASLAFASPRLGNSYNRESIPDPSEGAFSSAEVVHVVSVDSASRTTETWINRDSGDVTMTVTDDSGNLREAIVRQGLMLKRFTMDPELQPEYDTYLTTRYVLSSKDPILMDATNHLDLYRWGLEFGTVTEVGEVDFNGKRALKVEAFPTQGGHIAYLDPETLYPLGMQFSDGSEFIISYPVIETLQRSQVPTGAFEISLPNADYNEIYERLSSVRLSEFASFPTLNLGTTFSEFNLEIVGRYQANQLPAGTSKPENVYSIYYKRNAVGEVEGRIDVTVREPLSAAERDARSGEREKGLIQPPESVSVNGETVELSADGTTVTIERPDVRIIINAPERETVLAAAAALRPAAAAPEPVPPPIVMANAH